MVWIFNWVWIFKSYFGFSFQICVFNRQSSPGQASPRSCHRVFLWPARDWNRKIIRMKILASFLYGSVEVTKWWFMKKAYFCYINCKQLTQSLILTRKIGKRDLRYIHTVLHLYHVQFLWIRSHSLPMGKVIVWPTDLFTILSEKLEWNLSEISIFSLKSCF